MDSECRAVDRGSSSENHNIGHVRKRAKPHLYFDLNGPAQQEPEAPAIPVVNNVDPAPRPLEEFPGRNLDETYNKCIDWACGSISLGPEGELTLSYYKPKPMTDAERIESERRLALNAAVYEAQERDEAYYQGRLDNWSIERGLPLEDQNLDLDTSFVEDPWIPPL